MATLINRKIQTEPVALAPKAITVDPLTPVIGAEIGGVDLSKPLSPQQEAEIRAAQAAYHVLVFRDQVLSNEDHKRFARLFGTLHVHPYNVKKTAPEHARPANDKAPFAAEDPEILIVKADQNSKFVAGEGWHTDVTCDAEPPMGSMLYITKTPEIGGGDTMYSSTVRAYEALSDTMKEFVGKLTAVHDGAKPYTGGYGTAAPPGGWPKSTHPVVITIPWSGKKSLYVNRGFTTRINGLDRKESDAILEMLWRHIEDTVAFQCRVRWTPNTLVFWDNWCTQHHAVWDYYPYSRYGQRVSIVNGRPEA
ncbi:MAG: TauD/TfdA family dioxygenase [Alphaproteobacteria bacterium]|nr:TauD/TfdA family dioxygenase [Alphaproteobacteria bacterium]MBV9905830.1 TauD/TfdA family dioxygenase [Alphaproteobacteria bacterium]